MKDDQEIFSVLDMLMPNGFKAADLPAIEEWLEATRNLVAEIEGEQE